MIDVTAKRSELGKSHLLREKYLVIRIIVKENKWEVVESQPTMNQAIKARDILQKHDNRVLSSKVFYEVIERENCNIILV